jgi:hypothetical protein
MYFIASQLYNLSTLDIIIVELNILLLYGLFTLLRCDLLILSSVLCDSVLLLVIFWLTLCATRVWVVYLLSISFVFYLLLLSLCIHLLIIHGFNSGSGSVFLLGRNGSFCILVSISIFLVCFCLHWFRHFSNVLILSFTRGEIRKRNHLTIIFPSYNSSDSKWIIQKESGRDISSETRWIYSSPWTAISP